jgi:hypothetical protein
MLNCVAGQQQRDRGKWANEFIGKGPAGNRRHCAGGLVAFANQEGWPSLDLGIWQPSMPGNAAVAAGSALVQPDIHSISWPKPMALMN